MVTICTRCLSLSRRICWLDELLFGSAICCASQRTRACSLSSCVPASCNSSLICKISVRRRSPPAVASIFSAMWRCLISSRSIAITPRFCQRSRYCTNSSTTASQAASSQFSASISRAFSPSMLLASALRRVLSRSGASTACSSHSISCASSVSKTLSRLERYTDGMFSDVRASRISAAS